jgi:hypothetical protein
MHGRHCDALTASHRLRSLDRLQASAKRTLLSCGLPASEARLAISLALEAEHCRRVSSMTLADLLHSLEEMRGGTHGDWTGFASMPDLLAGCTPPHNGNGAEAQPIGDQPTVWAWPHAVFHFQPVTCSTLNRVDRVDQSIFRSMPYQFA